MAVPSEEEYQRLKEQARQEEYWLCREIEQPDEYEIGLGRHELNRRKRLLRVELGLDSVESAQRISSRKDFEIEKQAKLAELYAEQEKVTRDDLIQTELNACFEIDVSAREKVLRQIKEQYVAEVAWTASRDRILARLLHGAAPIRIVASEFNIPPGLFAAKVQEGLQSLLPFGIHFLQNDTHISLRFDKQTGLDEHPTAGFLSKLSSWRPTEMVKLCIQHTVLDLYEAAALLNMTESGFKNSLSGWRKGGLPISKFTSKYPYVLVENNKYILTYRSGYYITLRY
jgi:hypothetical protein